MNTQMIETKMSKAILLKPEKDTAFASKSAKILMDIVEQNQWSMSLGGKKKHLVYEAWQTLGKYYGYTVRTGEANFVEYGEVRGFEAKAWVIDNKTGIEIGGAEAACLTDEPNWKNKPMFQLKSMAQTRAGAKALRQILGFVAAIAGFNPTPAEEMVKEDNGQNRTYSTGTTEPIEDVSPEEVNLTTDQRLERARKNNPVKEADWLEGKNPVLSPEESEALEQQYKQEKM